MADETTQAPAGMEPAAGGPGAPAPVADSKPDYDKGDYTARLTHEPEFAASEVKRLTGELDKAKQSIKLAQPFLDNAKVISPASVEAGINAQLEAVRVQSQIQGDTKLFEAQKKILSGGQVQDSAASGDTGVDEDLFGEDIAKSSVIQELRQELATLRGQTAQTTAQASLKEYFDNDPAGKVLTQEERGEVLQEIMSSIQRAQQSGQGEVLSNLSKDTIGTIVANWMSRTGKLVEVGKRAAQQEAEVKQGMSMDSPSPISTGVQTEKNYKDMPTAKAVEAFMKDNGIDPWADPPIR